MMKLLIISVSLLRLWPFLPRQYYLLPREAGTTRASVAPVTISLQEVELMVDVKKLLAEDFEDQSLVYSTKH